MGLPVVPIRCVAPDFSPGERVFKPAGTLGIYISGLLALVDASQANQQPAKAQKAARQISAQPGKPGSLLGPNGPTKGCPLIQGLHVKKANLDKTR
jgi:hypothetical protein